MARTAVPVGVQRVKHFNSFLEAVPRPEASDDSAPLLGASLAADLSDLTFRAVGEAGAMVEGALAFYRSLGTPEGARNRMLAMSRQLKPRQLGTFFEGSAGGGDVGWWFPGNYSMATALGQVTAGSHIEALRAWALAHEVTTVLAIGGTVASAFTTLDVALPGTPAQQMAVALDLYARLQVRTPPTQATDALVAAGKPISLSLWLGVPEDAGDTGVAKIGLLQELPSTRLVLELCQLAGIRQDATLATFEGYLDVPGATAVEVRAVAGLLALDLHYNAGADHVTVP